jgi:hypothetical protein
MRRDDMDWKRPEIVEIKMDAEIGSYQEDTDPERQPEPVLDESED